MKKLKMHTTDYTQNNLAKIQYLFPGCITEIKDGNGSYKLSIDFDLLRQELSENVVEGQQERYQLNWPGKREALLVANAPIAKTLRPVPKDSLNFNTTKNLFLEGDNLEALKLLQEAYLGKVKMIYIDPPYNTGNDFIYDDDFAENIEEFLRKSNQKNKEGDRLVANTDSNGRFHSDWLSMMYSRLKLARNLLREDGVIFTSIDGRELDNLVKLHNEIFGETNNLGCFIWRKKEGGGMADSCYVTEHEYILVFQKSSHFKWKDEIVSANINDFPKEDKDGKYKLVKLAKWGNTARREDRPSMYFPIKDPDGKNNYPIAPDGSEGRWRIGKDKMTSLQSKKLIEFCRKNNAWIPYEKIYFDPDKNKSIKLRSILYDIGGTGDGSNELIELFERKDVFDNPKPTSIVKTLARYNTSGDDIILDFFAGSSTTAHAVMQLNAEDGSNRKFVMVQLPEFCDKKSEAYKVGFKTIADISKERIRRAGIKILEDECHEDWNQDIGFRVFKIDSSNLSDVYYTPDSIDQLKLNRVTNNIKSDRNSEDLLFQVLVDWGVDLSLPISKKIIKNKTVFFVDENALLACFDSGINEAFVKELTKFEPLRVVFRDNGFTSDSVKINVEQIFKQLSPHTEVKSI